MIQMSRRWFYGVCKRFVAFVVTVLTGAQGVSWIFGYDDEVRVWAAQNRGEVGIILALSAIMFAIYDALEEPHR